MLIDYIGWHASSEDFPIDIPPSTAGRHIGIYIVWLIEAGLLSKSLSSNCVEQINKVKRREQSGLGFLLEVLNGRLSSSMLNELGRDFTEEYYELNYIDDYFLALDPSAKFPTVFHIPDSWEHTERMRVILDHRYSCWLKQLQRFDEIDHYRANLIVNM